MNSGNVGENSNTKQCSENEKPFKKARYVWQIKGKRHLKNKYESNKNTNDNHGIKRSFKNIISQEDVPLRTPVQNNCESACNNICTSGLAVDALLIKSNNLLQSDDLKEQYIKESIGDETPVSLVQLSKHKDDLLFKWQARQVAKSFMDNTINSILENYKLAPFDANDMIENCENGEQVEDEGILMAIQSHGLQTNSQNIMFDCHRIDNVVSRNCLALAKTSSPSFVNLQQIHESNIENFENAKNEIKLQTSSSNDIEEMSCVPNIEIAIIKTTPQLELANSTDFLNTAVSVAIQKKGLLSYNYV